MKVKTVTMVPQHFITEHHSIGHVPGILEQTCLLEHHSEVDSNTLLGLF